MQFFTNNILDNNNILDGNGNSIDVIEKFRNRYSKTHTHTLKDLTHC